MPLKRLLLLPVLAPLLLAAALTGCDEGELLGPEDLEAAAGAALLMDDGNAGPSLLLGTRVLPVPMEVLRQLPARPGQATRIRIAVDGQGRITSARVVESAGNPELDRRALEAVRARTFDPGYPREFTTSVWMRPAGR
ncbi:MAG: energy transducer TonB [Gemmatimonadota bacterium]